MCRLNQNVLSQTLLSIYYSLLYLYLGYGVESWYSVTKAMSEKVRNLQKKWTRSIFKISNYGSTGTYFKRFNILQLPEIYRFQLCSSFEKYTKVGVTNNDYISNYLQLNSDIYTYITRIRDNFSEDQPLNLVSLAWALPFGNLSWIFEAKKEWSNFQSCFEEIPFFLNIWKIILLIQYLFNFTKLVYWLPYLFPSTKFLKIRFSNTIQIAILVLITTKLTKTITKCITLHFLIWFFLYTRSNVKVFFYIKSIKDDKLYIISKYCLICFSKLWIQLIFLLYFMFDNLVR